MSRVRALVVDDSAFARKVVREVLTRSGQVEVVDVARDGLEALEKIAALAPDVVTLDLVMPGLDGLGVLEALPRVGAPAVVVVSISGADSERGVAALQAGAFDLVAKPTALATDRLYELSDELVRKVVAASTARRSLPVPALVPRVAAPAAALGTELVVVGTSTGGPQALTRLLAGLPAAMPVPVALALHIPAGYTDALARRLDDGSALRVEEARDGLPLEPGLAALAPGGLHLKIAREAGRLVCRLDRRPVDAEHCPSVDVLFETAAEAAGAGVLGVVLTGMGDDGLRGAGRIRAAGGRLLVEAESSCIVYGMPRVVAEAGLAERQVELPEVAGAIVSML